MIGYSEYDTLQIKYTSHECATSFCLTSFLNQFKIRWIFWNWAFVNEKESNFRYLSFLIYIYKSSDFKISNLLAYRNWLNICTIFSW